MLRKWRSEFFDGTAVIKMIETTDMQQAVLEKLRNHSDGVTKPQPTIVPR